MLFSMRPKFKDVKISRYCTVSKDSTIGAHSYLGRNCHVSKTDIGRYVSIGNNVSIGNGEHDLRRVSTASMFYDDGYSILTELDCTIDADVWIGVDAIIRRGVHLGHGCVVGANSFVNKDVPAFAIVVGSPARIVGYRFEPEVRARILASEWWLMDPAEARLAIDALEAELGIAPQSTG